MLRSVPSHVKESIAEAQPSDLISVFTRSPSTLGYLNQPHFREILKQRVVSCSVVILKPTSQFFFADEKKKTG